MPKKPLTDKFVASVKPSNEVAQVDYFDKGYPALALRVGRREKVWTFHHREQGELKRKKLGRYPEMTLAEAREAWRMCRKALAEGASITTSASVPVESAVSQWFEAWQRDKRPNTIKAVRLHLNAIVAAWKGRNLASITDVDALALLDGITDRGASVQARRVYATLHVFLKWATKRKLIITDPMRAIEKKDLGSENSRDRVLSDSELGKLLTYIRGANQYDPFLAATHFLMLSGNRTEEVGALRWEEVQDDVIAFPSERMKNRIAFDLPITPHLKAVLDTVPRIAGCPYVFTADGKTAIKKWDHVKRRIDNATGITGWQIRDLRRTVATGIQKLGFAEDVADACIAHLKTGVKRVYLRHLYADEKRAAFEAWGAYLSGLVHRPSN
jgi:integrase